MKMSLSADELDELEGMSDADLTKTIRDSLAAYRTKRSKAEDDVEDPTASERAGTLRETEDDAEDPPADPSSAGHGGRTTSTLETGRSRGGNVNPGARDSAAILATQDAARQTHEARLRQDERDAEAESIIPGYRRL